MAAKKEKFSQRKKININDDTLNKKRQKITPFYELRELFTKNTGAEKQERRVFFTQLRKNCVGKSQRFR